jgi:hypothetical protein
VVPADAYEIININGVNLMAVTAKISNIGLSRVLLRKEGSGLSLYSYPKDNYVPKVHLAVWNNKPNVFSIFENHSWIEPNETVDDKLLIPILVKDILIWKIEMIIVTKIRFKKTNLKWTIVTIVPNTKC